MSEVEDFNAFTGGYGFQHIDDILDRLDDAGFWSVDFLAKATTYAKKARIRQLIKQSKDESGWPLWASIVITPQDGEPYRVYQQELFMNKEAYRQVINYWIEYVQHGMTMGEGYRNNLTKRYGEQLQLFWE